MYLHDICSRNNDFLTKTNQTFLSLAFIFSSVFKQYTDLNSFNTGTLSHEMRLICQHRQAEGIYINESLNVMRHFINQQIYRKNARGLEVIPMIDNECRKSMYYNETKKQQLPLDIMNNTMIDAIKKYSSTNLGSNFPIFDNLIIAILLVVNLNRTANNPPPIPYINIQSLKRIFFNNQLTPENIFTAATFEELGKAIHQTQNKINELNYTNKLANLQNLSQYKEFLITHQRYKLSPDTSHENKIYLNALELFINAIETNNAATTIGSLEYIDKVAKNFKYYNICDLNQENFEFKTKYLKYKIKYLNITKVDFNLNTILKEKIYTDSIYKEKYLKYKNKYLKYLKS